MDSGLRRNDNEPVGADLCVCPHTTVDHCETMGEHVGSPLHLGPYPTPVFPCAPCHSEGFEESRLHSMIRTTGLPCGWSLS